MKKIMCITIIILSLVTSLVLLTAMSPVSARCNDIGTCEGKCCKENIKSECSTDKCHNFGGDCTCSSTVKTGGAVTASINIGAKSGYLTDSESGRVLYAKGENERYEIASMVKIMTALLTFESIENGSLKIDEMVTVSHNAAKQTGSELFIDEGQSYSVSDLLKGVIVVSANDASVALAERIAGSEEAFVTMMNDRAKALEMNDTLFVNTTGLPQGEQYSTAHNVNRMTRALLAHKDYYNYSTIWLEDYAHPSGRITQLANTNKLIRFYKGCDSGKTGYTDSAKYCLSASAKRGDMRVVATLLGSDDSKVRFREVSSMLDYAFANYKRVNLMTAGEEIGQEVKLIRATDSSIKPIVKDNLSVLVARGEAMPTVKIEVIESAKAPLAKGDKLGIARVMVGEVEAGSTLLVAPRDVTTASYWDYVRKIIK